MNYIGIWGYGDMLTPKRTKVFRKDVKRLQKGHKDMNKLKVVIDMLLEEKPLPPEYNNHQLIGNYKGNMECHIEPDWLLIYYISDNTLHLVRTGSHSTLF